MTEIIKPNPESNGEFRTFPGRLEIDEDALRQLAEYAKDVENTTLDGFRDFLGIHDFPSKGIRGQIQSTVLDVANYYGKLGIDEEVTALYKVLEDRKVFPLNKSERWNFNETNTWYIPVTDAAGNDITDSFTIEAIDTKNGKMLCYGFGPENPTPTNPDDNFLYYIDFVADYTKGSQELEILWSSGTLEHHPELEKLTADFKS